MKWYILTGAEEELRRLMKKEVWTLGNSTSLNHTELQRLMSCFMQELLLFQPSYVQRSISQQAEGSQCGKGDYR